MSRKLGAIHLLGADFRQENAERAAMQLEDHAGVLEEEAQPVAIGRQHLIAHLGAHGVVDRLQPPQVDHDEQAAIALFAHVPVEDLYQVVAVGQARLLVVILEISDGRIVLKGTHQQHDHRHEDQRTRTEQVDFAVGEFKARCIANLENARGKLPKGKKTKNDRGCGKHHHALVLRLPETGHVRLPPICTGIHTKLPFNRNCLDKTLQWVSFRIR